MKHAVMLCAALALSGQAQALGRLADVQVMDRTTGTTLQVYQHRGKRYIVGEPGHEYAISLSSRENGRMMAVGSVDGVNILSGETARTDQNGYVLSAWEQMSINGWRTSLQSTAAFYFTTVNDSYAARTGRPGDLGVIGFALYREKKPCCSWWRRDQPQEYGRSESDLRSQSQAPSAAASPPAAEARRKAEDSRVGTGYGRTEYSEVSFTEFEPASSRPDEVVAIYYNSYENLRKQGVIPPPPHTPPPYSPQPFPAGGFVPPP